METKEINAIFDLRGVIYMIECWVDGKCYIGQTVKSFAKRYGGLGLWWDCTTSKPLRAAIKRLGAGAFRVRILEHSKTPQELNELEVKHAIERNSYFPNGYNVQPCGYKKALFKKSNLYYLNESAELRSPDGTIHTVSNLDTFCDSHRLEKYAIWCVVTKKRLKWHGWTRADAPTKTYRGGKRFTFFDTAGTKHEIYCLRRFCDDHKLDYDRMTSMLLGRVPASQGYALSPEGFLKQRKRKIVTLVNGDREAILTNVNKESSSLDLDWRSVHALVSGKRKELKGWTLKGIEYVPIG